MENRVKAPARKALANSPGRPKLGESGFYSTSPQRHLDFRGYRL